MQDGPDQETTRPDFGYTDGPTRLTPTASRDVSPLDTAVESQSKSLDYLHDRLDTLTMRLERVMRAPHDSNSKSVAGANHERTHQL